MKRGRMKRKPPPGGFPEEVRMFVRRRSGGKCEVGSSVCTEKAAHFHHRKLRRHKDNSSINCLYACQPCHTLIHDKVQMSYLLGWLVHSWDDPAEIPVKRGAGAA
jgi:predicted metal-binding protein